MNLKTSKKGFKKEKHESKRWHSLLHFTFVSHALQNETFSHNLNQF